MLKFEHVDFSYDKKREDKKREKKCVLHDFSLKLEAGERVCLFGPSGCGKSTALRLAMGLEKADAGAVVNTFSRVAPVFQEDRLFPTYSLIENVNFGCSRDGGEILKAVGLDALKDKFPDQVSGGQKRRAAFARALNYESDLLILDEPFNGLDETSIGLCAAALETWAAGRAVLMVSHLKEHAVLLHARIVSMTDDNI